jgi:hypothetical protein
MKKISPKGKQLVPLVSFMGNNSFPKENKKSASSEGTSNFKKNTKALRIDRV